MTVIGKTCTECKQEFYWPKPGRKDTLCEKCRIERNAQADAATLVQLAEIQGHAWLVDQIAKLIRINLKLESFRQKVHDGIRESLG